MNASAGVRGRPATLRKTDLELEDGSVLTVRLLGRGDTIQLELPAQWNLSAFARSITTNGGRTRVSFVSGENAVSDSDTV